MSETKLTDQSEVLGIVFSVSHHYEEEQENDSIRDIIAIDTSALTTALQPHLFLQSGWEPTLDNNPFSCKCLVRDGRQCDSEAADSTEFVCSKRSDCSRSISLHKIQYHCDIDKLVHIDADAHFAGCLAKVLRSSSTFVIRFLRYLRLLHQRKYIGLSKLQSDSKVMRNLRGTSSISETENMARSSLCPQTHFTENHHLNSSSIFTLKNNSSVRSESVVPSTGCCKWKWNQSLICKSKRHSCRRASRGRERLCSYLDALLSTKAQYERSGTGLGETENESKCAVTMYRAVLVSLHPARSLWLDLAWFYRVEELIIKTAMLDDALNWLSTLGGAYSALGDHFQHHAENAQRISYTQLRVAVEMDCEPVISRCYLYIALSEMQQGRLRTAKRIIRHQFVRAKGMTVIDTRLIAMCRGMWSRLRYLYSQSRCSIPKNALSLVDSDSVTNGHNIHTLTNGHNIQPNASLNV